MKIEDLPPQDQAREDYLIASEKTRAFRFQEFLKNMEKRGMSFGMFRRRFTREKTPSAFAAFGKFSVGLAAIVGDQITTSATKSLQVLTNMASQLNNNGELQPELTQAFDGANIHNDFIVQQDVYNELKADETLFQQQLETLSRQNVPNLKISADDAFAQQQRHIHEVADNFGLRVLFDAQGNTYYAHDMAKVERLTNQFDGRPAINAVAEPSVTIMVFTTASRPSDVSQTDHAQAHARAHQPAPHYN